jgi:hypothetical protein
LRPESGSLRSARAPSTTGIRLSWCSPLGNGAGFVKDCSQHARPKLDQEASAGHRLSAGRPYPPRLDRGQASRQTDRLPPVAGTRMHHVVHVDAATSATTTGSAAGDNCRSGSFIIGCLGSFVCFDSAQSFSAEHDENRSHAGSVCDVPLPSPPARQPASEWHTLAGNEIIWRCNRTSIRVAGLADGIRLASSPASGFAAGLHGRLDSVSLHPQ